MLLPKQTSCNARKIFRQNLDGPEVNDNLLMLTGGIKPLEMYCDTILKPEEEGSEGFSGIKTHPLSLPPRAKPEVPAKGCLLRLMRDDMGILGRNDQVSSGRFAAINAEYLMDVLTGNGIRNFAENYSEKKGNSNMRVLLRRRNRRNRCRTCSFSRSGEKDGRRPSLCRIPTGNHRLRPTPKHSRNFLWKRP